MTVHLFNVQSRDESWLKVDSAVNQTAEVKEVYTVYIRKMRSRYFLFFTIKIFLKRGRCILVSAGREIIGSHINKVISTNVKIPCVPIFNGFILMPIMLYCLSVILDL